MAAEEVDRTKAEEVEEEQAKEVDDYRRVRVGEEPLPPLMEMVSGIDVRDWQAYSAENVPLDRELLLGVLRQLRRIELRHAAVRDVLDGTLFTFEGNADDAAVYQQAALTEVDEATELVEELCEALSKWFRCFGWTRLVELAESTMPAVDELATSLPAFDHRNHKTSLVVRAAVEHLAANPAAAKIIAESEQRRQCAIIWEDRAEDERHPRVWPWAQADGAPWSEGKSKKKRGGATAAG